jgi:hypothetical protein
MFVLQNLAKFEFFHHSFMNHLVLNEGLILGKFSDQKHHCKMPSKIASCFFLRFLVSPSGLPGSLCISLGSPVTPTHPTLSFLVCVFIHYLPPIPESSWISLYLPRSTVSPINFSDLLVSPTNLSEISLYASLDQPSRRSLISLYLPRISLYLHEFLSDLSVSPTNLIISSYFLVISVFPEYFGISFRSPSNLP